MESSELAAPASRRVSLPSGGSDSKRRAPLLRLSRQVSFSRLPYVGCPRFFVLGFVLPHQVRQYLLSASFLGQAKQWTSI